ncbi:MAG TPA: hypothetical protein ENI23_06435 [bacterium]|nr:hypothetical protein [bacterium]
MDKPKCKIDKCNNNAMFARINKKGERKYKKLCYGHHRKKYRMSPNSKIRKNGSFTSEYYDIDTTKCSLCGWDKAPCDRHRIEMGMNGGKYIKGNMLSLCPNCHKLVHLGLSIK